MKEIICQAWQLVHSWATTRPLLFIMMNIMIGGIVATSARRRGKTCTDAVARQASLFTTVMSRTFSGRNVNYDWELRKESMAPSDNDYQETQYEDEDGDEDEGGEGYEVKEENHSEKREEEEDQISEVKAEIQEEVQRKSKHPLRNERPSLSRRTRQSSRVPPPGEGSSGEIVTLSASSGEIAGAASSSTRQVRVQAPPTPGGLNRSGSFLSSLLSFRRGLDRNIPQSTGSEGAPEDRKNQGEIQSTEVDTEAEDFIRKFRRQLKLQRLESLLQRQVKTDK